MNSEIIHIDFFHLLIGYLMLLIPIGFFYYFKVDLIKSTLISVFRMSIQLILVGFYLESIFKINSALINSLWVIAMIFIGVYTTIKRAKLKFRYFIFPLVFALSASMIIISTYFFAAVLESGNFFDARYFIPVAGMILGNAMNYNIISLNTYFESLIRDENQYYFLLVNSGNPTCAKRPFIRSAMSKALNPLIGTMMVMGIISLPGMMTGQILGGSLPTTAIKYQILIAVAIFSAGTLNLALSIIFSNRFVFDKYGRLNRDIFK